MAGRNFYNPTPGPLFPSARGMRQTSTTLATGMVPGVNTLISPMAKHAVVATVAESPRPGGRVKAPMAAHSLTEEEILQQKVFAARLLGAPPVAAVASVGLPVMPVAVQNVGVNGVGVDASAIASTMNSHVGSRLVSASMASVMSVVPARNAVVAPQHLQGVPRYPNHLQQQQHQQQQQLLEQSRVNAGAVVGSLNTPPQQQFLPNQQLQQQQLPQKQFGQQAQPFIPQDQQKQQQSAQQQGFQNFNATFTGRPNNAINPGPRWPGNAGKGNQNVVGTVRGAFGKSPSGFPPRPTDGAINARPGILGAYPATQKFGVPIRNLTPQTSQLSPQPKQTPVTTTYSTPSSSSSTSTSVISNIPPSAAVQPSSIQLQPNFKDTLQGLTFYESESLRKALLSGKMELLGLTSAQALDILQALKSISSKGKPLSQSPGKGDKSDGNWTDSVSTNWPGTADDDAKSHRHEGQGADNHRGLGSILESLRSEYTAANEEKQKQSGKRWDNMMPRGSDAKRDGKHPSYQDPVIRLQSNTDPNQAIFAPVADALVGGDKDQGKENRGTRWDLPPFIPGDISHSSQPITEHVISSINENLEILQMQREKLVQSQTSLAGQSGDGQGQGAKQRRSNENTRRSRSRERHDIRHAGDRSGRSDPKYSRSNERDRDRHGYRDRDRDWGRDNRGERRRSRENEQPRRSPGRHRNDAQKRSIGTPPSSEKTRSGSRERKDPGRRSTSWERRERRHLSNDRQDSSSQRRRGDSPDAKRRRPNQRGESLWRSSGTRGNQGVRTPAWYQRKKDAIWNRKPKTDEPDQKPVPSSEGSKPSQEGDRKPKDAPSQTPQSKSKPIPLLNIVIPRKSFRREDSSSVRKSASAPTSKSSTKPSSTKASATLPSSGDPKAKTSNSEDKTKNRKEESKLTVVEASKAAAAMSETPLLEKLGESSIQHQLDLLKEIGLEDYIKDKEVVDWYCYICGKFCNVWSIYLSHVEGRRHKTLFRRLHEVGHAALKKTLIGKLAELPEKGKGDPEKQNRISQPSYAIKPPVPSVNSTPLNDLEQAFFCGKCFRTYICSYEEHLLSEDHKRSAKLRPKCSLCNLTFLNLRSLKTHCTMLSHIRKAQENGEDTSHLEGNEAILDSDEGEEDEGAELKTGKGGGLKEIGKLKAAQMADISGSEFITPISGFFCKLCSKFYNKEKTAKMVHCRTPAHKLKVKQYYQKRIKSSVASLKSTPGISINESASSATAKTSSKQDGVTKKDATPTDAPPKYATPKDAPPKNAPPKDPSSKDAPIKNVPSKDAVPKGAPPKNALPKDTLLPVDAQPDKDSKSSKYAPTKNGPTKNGPTKHAPPYNGPPKSVLPYKDVPRSRSPLLRKDNFSKDAVSDRTAGHHGDTPQGSAKADFRSPPKTDMPKEKLSMESSRQETPPPRKASSKLVLSIPKMSTSAIAAINGPSKKDTKPPTATPKLTTPKVDTSKSVTPKPVKTSIVDTYRSRRAAAVDTTAATSKVTPSAKPQEKPNIKPEASLTATETREESGSLEKPPKKDDSMEEETRQTDATDEEEDEWTGEVPDFDNMIFIDEVGESDEDEILLDEEDEEFDIADEDMDEDES